MPKFIAANGNHKKAGDENKDIIMRQGNLRSNPSLVVMRYTAGFRSATWLCCENPTETLSLPGYFLKTRED